MTAKKKESDASQIRLSDRILYALQLALAQDDVQIAKTLALALEMSMTRNTGGGEFIERRDYSKELEDAMTRMSQIKGKK